MANRVFVVLVSLQRLKMYLNQKKKIPILFLPKKSSFKVPALAMLNEVDHNMKEMVMIDITSGTSQSVVFLFCLLNDQIALPTSVCLFFVDEKLLTTQSSVTWTSRIWHFLFWLTHGQPHWAWLERELRALKCRNPMLFSENDFLHIMEIKVPINYINPVGHIDTLKWDMGFLQVVYGRLW